LGQQGQFEAAEPLLLNCLERDPDDISILRALALGNIKAKQHRKVQKYLDRWCALQPDDPEPFRVRCQWAYRGGHWAQALADGERLLPSRPDDPEIMRIVVNSLRREGRTAEAESACQRFLARRPRDPFLLYLLAESYHAQGKEPEASAVLDALLPHLPAPMPQALALRGVLYVQAGQAEKAVPLLQQALSQNPGDDRARYQLCLALARLDRGEEAEKQMARFLRKVDGDRLRYDRWSLPENVALRVRSAHKMIEDGRLGEGVRVLREILAQNPGHKEALDLLRKYEGKGAYDPANPERKSR
jgi:predicted Zn-dependent protease